jgi:hypothetical protein
MPPHLLVDVSSHGFGHLAQVAPVLNALASRSPEVRITVRTSLPPSGLRERIAPPFVHRSVSLDVGLNMLDPVRVRWEESARAYLELHRDWERKVAAQAQEMARLGADLVLSDVPYLSLAAAAAASIPAIAMSSLNWADIFQAYFGDLPSAAQIHGQILSAYREAELFVQPVPHMPMEDLQRRRRIAPIASVGRNRRDEIEAKFRVAPEEQLALVALGGVPARVPLEQWPRSPGIRWIVPDTDALHPDAIATRELGLPFLDLLASCDAVLTKPGYGTFVEALVHGAAVLYLPRPDWPESACLIEWLEQHARFQAIAWSDLESGQVAEPLRHVLAQPSPPPVNATGAQEAVEILALYL